MDGGSIISTEISGLPFGSIIISNIVPVEAPGRMILGAQYICSKIKG